MVTCIETMTCMPEKPLEIFNYWLYQYGIPVPIILGLIVGLVIGAIYVRTRSLAHLAVMTIYAITVFGTMLISDAYIESQYHMILYVVAIAIASVIVMMVMKLVKE